MELYGYIPDIKNRIRGSRVLDIGCLGSYDHTLLKRYNQYKETAKEIIGLDFNKEFLDMVRKEGATNLYYCDMTNIEDVKIILDKFGQFDHIIATDIIEHIGNLTLFLDNVKSLMTEKGHLYLTTPNMKSPAWWAMSTEELPAKAGYVNIASNDDHVCWFDLETLICLLNRSGLRIVRNYYCILKKDKNLMKKLGVAFKPWMGRRLYTIVEKGE